MDPYTKGNAPIYRDQKRDLDTMYELAAIAQDNCWTGPVSEDQSAPMVCSEDGRCFLVPSDGDLHIRGLLHNVTSHPSHELQWHGRRHLESLNFLAKRRQNVVCIPGEKNVIIKVPSHPSVDTLAKRRGISIGIPNPFIFWTVIKAGNSICQEVKAGWAARSAVNNYVTEHVSEIQVTKMFAQSMLEGQLPNGCGAPDSYKFDWTQIFRDHYGGKGKPAGAFYKDWRYVGVPRPREFKSGRTPVESLMAAITQADQNLLIAEADTNAMKASVCLSSGLSPTICSPVPRRYSRYIATLSVLIDSMVPIGKANGRLCRWCVQDPSLKLMSRCSNMAR